MNRLQSVVRTALPLARLAGFLDRKHETKLLARQIKSDPHAREHALDIARQEPPDSLSPDQAVAELRGMLDSIGDTCPECPSSD